MSPENLCLCSLPPLHHIAHANLRKVSAVGQLTVPAPVIRRWNMAESGHVFAYDLDSAVLVDSKDAEPIAEADQIQVVGEYAVSRAGQMTLSAKVRNRWGLKSGGNVEFLDLRGPVLFLPKGGSTVLMEEFLSERDVLTEILREKE